MIEDDGSDVSSAFVLYAKQSLVSKHVCWLSALIFQPSLKNVS